MSEHKQFTLFAVLCIILSAVFIAKFLNSLHSFLYGG